MSEQSGDPGPTLQFLLGEHDQRAPIEVDVKRHPPAVILQPGAVVNEPFVKILSDLTAADDGPMPEQ